MDTNTCTFPSDAMHSEDALKVLGRIADAFDNPSVYKMDRELVFVVNVVKSRRVLESPLSKHHQDGSFDSWLDFSYDDDVELGDVSWRERTSSCLYASRGQPSHERIFHRVGVHDERCLGQDDGTRDVGKMLLTSSPLDRLDRLARMELKKAGWIERADKWTVVEMGLAGPPLPSTLYRRGTSKDSRRTLSQKTTCRRYDSEKQPLLRKGGGPEGQRPSRSASMRSPGECRDYEDADGPSLSYANVATPLQTRGRLGQVMRKFVKKMLPPSSGESSTPRSCESGWTSSASRWSGFWH